MPARGTLADEMLYCYIRSSFCPLIKDFRHARDNSQVTSKLTQRLLDLARQVNVPVVGITETQPANVSFQDWMLGELGALEKALGRPNS